MIAEELSARKLGRCAYEEAVGYQHRRELLERKTYFNNFLL